MTTLLEPPPVPEPSSPVDTTASYSGFISYSHADVPLAAALAAALHGFAKPWYRLRALHLFLDTGCLTANPALWSSIVEALEGSGTMILLASPEAAQSAWVQREADYWCEHKSTESLLLVLSAGAVVWDEDVGDFDWERTTALPPSLRGRFSQEPLYVDLRWARGSDRLTVKDPRFADAVATIAAPLHHRPKEDLVGDDVRNHRRVVRLARTAIAVLTVLALLAASAAVLAVQQRDEARRQERLAQSRAVAAQAVNAVDSRLDRALLLAVEAYRIEPTADARGALLAAVVHTDGVDHILAGHDTMVTQLAVAPTGTLAASGDARGEVMLWDIGPEVAGAEPRRVAQLEGITSLTFLDRGRELLATSRTGDVVRWRTSDGTEVERGTLHVQPSAVDPTGVVAAAFRPDEQGVDVISVQDGELLTTVPIPVSGYGTATLSRGGRLLAVRTGIFEPGRVDVWDLEAGRLARPTIPMAGGQGLAFDEDETHVLAGDAEGSVCAWPVSGTGEPSCTEHGEMREIVAGPFGVAVSLADRSISIDEGDGAPFPLLGHSGVVSVMAATPDGTRLLAGDGTGAIFVWDLTLAAGLRSYTVSLTGAEDWTWGLEPAAASPDGTVFAAMSEDGLEVWERARGEASDTWERTLVVGDLQYFVEGITASSEKVVTAGSVLGVHVWDLTAAAPEPVLILDPDEDAGYYGAAFSPDGRTLVVSNATLEDGDRGPVALQIYDASTLELRHALEVDPPDGSTDFPMAVSDDLLAGASGSRVWLRDLVTGEVRADVDVGGNVDSIAISRAGSLVAVAREYRIELWDLAAGDHLGDLPIQAEWTTWIAFSSDAELLVAGHADDTAGTASVWDVEQRRPLGAPIMVSSPDEVRYVAVTDDDHLFAVGGASLYELDLRVDSWVARACDVARRDLTEAEVRQYLGRDRLDRPTCSG